MPGRAQLVADKATAKSSGLHNGAEGALSSLEMP